MSLFVEFGFVQVAEMDSEVGSFQKILKTLTLTPSIFGQALTHQLSQPWMSSWMYNKNERKMRSWERHLIDLVKVVTAISHTEGIFGDAVRVRNRFKSNTEFQYSTRCQHPENSFSMGNSRDKREGQGVTALADLAVTTFTRSIDDNQID